MDARHLVPDAMPPVHSWEVRGFAVAAAPPRTPSHSLHDPPLQPRDEAVFLLTAAAEVEHALMVQYLYAAYSVRVAGPRAATLRTVQDLLVQIAREEMGHLATVQNLLRLVGGSLHLGREHSAQAGGIAPFRFRLEPLSLDSLAKYVTAESPAEPPPELSAEDRALVEQIKKDAALANGGEPVRHVGPFFERLATLFGGGVDGLADDDLRVDDLDRQARYDDWGFDPQRPEAGEALIVDSFAPEDVASVRAAAVAAVQRIGLQGEGFDIGPGSNGSESHFERFLDLYRRVSDLTSAGVAVTWPVATDPTTASSLASPDAGERITAPRARAWAQLFDLRYRLLLGQLQHVLSLDGPLYRDTSGAERGDRTGRGLLLLGTFDEMRRLRKIAGKLMQLPKDDPPGGVHAGPPFELPYTLVLPDREPARWRQHLDTSRAAARLIRERLAGEQDDFLDDLLARAETEQKALASLADGQGVPADCLPTGFAKAVTILEEAVRGFSIGAHGAFWAGRSRDEVLDVPVFGQPPIAQGPDGTVVPDPGSSRLIQRLEAQGPGRMPRFRPPVPASRIGYLRDWIAAGCPDDVPAGRVGVAHERDPAAEAGAPEPPPGGTTGFAADIAGLFRADIDRASMLFRFDLHRYEDVRDHATAILARLEDGTMPCDGPWPADRVALFRRWIEDGRQP